MYCKLLFAGKRQRCVAANGVPSNEFWLTDRYFCQIALTDLFSFAQARLVSDNGNAFILGRRFDEAQEQGGGVCASFSIIRKTSRPSETWDCLPKHNYLAGESKGKDVC